MNEELAAYIATYINEELERPQGATHVTQGMVLSAVDAYEGGSR